MKKKVLLQVTMLISLLSVRGLLYGKNRTLDYGDGTIYRGEIEYEDLPEESRFNLIDWVIYKVFGVMEPHGIGKLTFGNGEVYEGNFVHGRMTGEGKRTFVDGSSVEGNFTNGIINGKGKHTFPNGNFYEGDFKDGEMTGKGKIVDADGNVIQEGSFFNGERVDSYELFIRDGYVIYKDLITDEETVIKKTDKKSVEISLSDKGMIVE